MKTRGKKIKPYRIEVTDKLDGSKIQIEPGYGGILFISHFAISKTDALYLSKFLKEIAQPPTDKGEVRK